MRLYGKHAGTFDGPVCFHIEGTLLWEKTVVSIFKYTLHVDWFCFSP